ncbi:MAG: Flp family type IVb pilin [Bacillaceae bacterium]|nr:Flp family type IVb pilin [Bacillaceae bacterium]
MLDKLKAFLDEEKGQGMTEYGITVGVVAFLTVLAYILILSDDTREMFEKTTAAIRSIE